MNRLPNVANDATSVVVVGAFNPAIFSATWLKSESLISTEEHDDFQLDFVTNKASQMQVADLRITVTRERLQIFTEAIEQAERLRDLCVGILRSLPHTPVAALGINRMVHFEVDSSDRYHSIGDTLVPKGSWEKVVRFPATGSLSIVGLRPESDNFGGGVTIRVEPSTVLQMGVFVAVNDHYDLTVSQAPKTSRQDVKVHEVPESSPEKLPRAIDLLLDTWSESQIRAEDAVRFVDAIGRLP